MLCSYGLVKVLDVFWFDTSKPEFPGHSFGAVSEFDLDTQAVYVFKRFDSKSIKDGAPRRSVS